MKSILIAALIAALAFLALSSSANAEMAIIPTVTLTSGIQSAPQNRWAISVIQIIHGHEGVAGWRQPRQFIASAQRVYVDAEGVAHATPNVGSYTNSTYMVTDTSVVNAVMRLVARPGVPEYYRHMDLAWRMMRDVLALPDSSFVLRRQSAYVDSTLIPVIAP